MFWGSMLCHPLLDFTVVIFCIAGKTLLSYVHTGLGWPVSVTVM